MNYGRKF